MLKKNLMLILEKKNITIAELSRQTNVPKSNLSSWLKGRSPNIDQLDKVARFLGTTIEHLVFGRKQKMEEPIMLYRLEIENSCYEIIVRKIHN